MHLFYQYLGGMTDSVNSVQEQSDLGLHCLYIPVWQKKNVREIVGHYHMQYH